MSGPVDPPQSRHDPALDGVRGLAILLVLFTHLFPIGNNLGGIFFRVVVAIQRSAWVGVDLFFALSGYLITGILWNSLGGSGYFRNFYVRRCLRISPLYYAVLLILLGLTATLHLTWHGLLIPLLFYLQSAGLVRTGGSLALSPVINLLHFWSLAVEEQFYLVWPLCLFLLRRPRRIVCAAIVGSLLSLLLRILLLRNGCSLWVLYTSTPCRLDGILLGSGLALAIRGRYGSTILRVAPLVFLGSVIVLLLIGVPDGLNWQLHPSVLTFGLSMVAIACVSFIAWVIAPGSSIRRAVSSHFLRFFGRYSYGIYIFHFIAGEWIDTHLRRTLIPVVHSRILAGFLSSTAVVVGSILLALISYHCFEVHFLRLKKFFKEPARRPDLPGVTVS